MDDNQLTYGLVGLRLGHSFSKEYFTEKFKREGIDAQYVNYEIPDVSDIKEIIKANPKLVGFNVTIPYKSAIIPYLDSIDDTAKSIGAVNTVCITRKGDNTITKGYNTDIIGFTNSIEPLLEPSMEKALILGTGGASKAVKESLTRLGISSKYVSRSPKEDMLGYKDLTTDIMEDYTIIINTTPLGTWPDVESNPLIPYELLSNKHLCYDLVYNPSMTKFMQKAKEHGAKITNGLAMLHGQAEAAWKIWNNQN